MKGSRAELNRFLVEVFDEILKTEEESLAGSFSDLSLRELHLIEEVCRAEDEARDNREILKTLSDQEAQVLVRALGSLTAFFREKYEA